MSQIEQAASRDRSENEDKMVAYLLMAALAGVMLPWIYFWFRVAMAIWRSV